MTKVILISIATLFSVSIQADIKAWCASEWPGDYEMQEYCLKNQSEANNKMFSYAESNGLVKGDGTLAASSRGSAPERILNKCMIKWRKPKFDTYDFQMVMYCTNNQVKAYNRLNK